MRRALTLLLLLAGLTGCGGGGDDQTADASGCVPDLVYFEQSALPVLEAACVVCHTAQGQARNTRLVLQEGGQSGALRANFDAVEASLGEGGAEIWLATARGEGQHPASLEAGSPEHDALEILLGRYGAPVRCASGEDVPSAEKVRLLDLPATLRRVKLQLAGELPTPGELQQVADGGEAAFDELVAGYLERGTFYDVLERWYGAHLHTDRYLGGNRATDLLDEARWPERRYYDGLPEDTEAGRLARRWANDSLARAPLKLISHVVRSGRPFTEVLTADYLLVNPFSAPLFGLAPEFEDPTDPESFVEARLPDVPHAGVLTTPTFLARWPTSDSNRNRRRARVLWDVFMGTDVLVRAEQPADPSAIEDFNPTMNSPQCAVCHAIIDPVAGAFLNWDARGRYAPPEMGWPDTLRPAGFEQEVLPSGELSGALRWLAGRLTADERFALGAARVVYEGLIGRPPLGRPESAGAPEAGLFEEERAFLEALQRRLIEGGFDLKPLIPEIARSLFYRAVAAKTPLSAQDARALGELGRMNLLGPAALSAKLVAVTGYPWKRRVGDADNLLSGRAFRDPYGGVDHHRTTRSLPQPSGLAAAVALRMAAEMGCLVTPRDFARPAEQRRLFPHVEPSFEPEDGNGFEIPGAVAAIKRNIRFLHQRVLGELLSEDSPQIDATYQLFLQTWREGRAGVENETLSPDLPGPCRYVRDFESDEALPDAERLYRDPRYTLRAWSAVITYLLADWRFLYD